MKRGHGWHRAPETQPAGAWVWDGPRVPNGEFGAQSAALAARGLIQTPLAPAGASAAVPAFGFGFGSVSPTPVAETFPFFPPPTYSSAFSHLASGSAEA